MIDEDLDGLWGTIEPSGRQRRRIDARVAAWLEARDTPLASEWLVLFTFEPFTAAVLVALSALAIVTAPPVVWLVSALL
jgi:hypothetical protein